MISFSLSWTPESPACSTCVPQTRKRPHSQTVESTERRRNTWHEIGHRLSWSSSRSHRELPCSGCNCVGGSLGALLGLSLLVWASLTGMFPPPGEPRQLHNLWDSAKLHLHVVWRSWWGRRRLQWIRIPRCFLWLKLRLKYVWISRCVPWWQLWWGWTQLGRYIWKTFLKYWLACFVSTCWHSGLCCLAKSDRRLAVDVLAPILLPYLDHRKWMMQLSLIIPNIRSCFSYIFSTIIILLSNLLWSEVLSED